MFTPGGGILFINAIKEVSIEGAVEKSLNAIVYHVKKSGRTVLDLLLRPEGRSKNKIFSPNWQNFLIIKASNPKKASNVR